MEPSEINRELKHAALEANWRATLAGWSDETDRLQAECLVRYARERELLEEVRRARDEIIADAVRWARENPGEPDLEAWERSWLPRVQTMVARCRDDAERDGDTLTALRSQLWEHLEATLERAVASASSASQD